MGNAIRVTNEMPAMRWHEIIGDGWEPELRRGDFFAVAPAHEWIGDAIYLLDDIGGAISIYRCTNIGGGKIRLSLDNPRYESFEVTRDWFDSHVIARAVGKLQVFGSWR